MATLSDTKFEALRSQGHTGALNDMLLQYYQTAGATSPCINDAHMEWLILNGELTGTLNDRMFSLLRKTYTGALNDMELEYWTAEIIP
jgi:hypothetical protein